MRLSLLFIGLVILAGCSESAKYDIDLKCHEDPIALEKDYSSDGESFKMTCLVPDYFEITCDAETVQRIVGGYLCSTHDGKSVRVERNSK